MNGCCCKIFVILPLLLSVAITAFASTDKENKSEIEKSYKKLVEERITWGLLKINFVPKKFETRNNGINVSLLSVCVFQGPRGNQRPCLSENVTKRILLSAFFFFPVPQNRISLMPRRRYKWRSGLAGEPAPGQLHVGVGAAACC